MSTNDGGAGTIMLEKLELQNFRGFESLDLTFEPDITLLIGANGSGKSSVLEAIAACLAGQSCSAMDVRLGTDALTIRLASETTRLAMEIKTIAEVGFSLKNGPSSNISVLNRHNLDVIVYRTHRQSRDLTPGATSPKTWSLMSAVAHAHDASSLYGQMFEWFRDMEDRENERFRDGHHDEDPSLAAVRRAVEALLPGVKEIRVRRNGAMGVLVPRLTVTKAGSLEPFVLDALSEGEKTLLAMVADIARRLAIAHPDASNPLEEPLTVLIDELEQHLHPGWQRSIVGRLRRVFPRIQWICTTQSPVLVTEIEPRCLRVLKDFRLWPIAPHRAGSDVNAVLEEAFDTQALPEKEASLRDRLQTAIDRGEIALAKTLVNDLAVLTSDNAPEVVFHRSLIARLEG